MENTRGRSPRPSQGQCRRRMWNKKQPSHYKKSFDPKSAYMQKDRCSKCGDSTHLEGFQCPAKRYQCKRCHKFGHFTSLCFMKGQPKQAYHKSHKPKAIQLTAGQYKHMTVNQNQKVQITPFVSSSRLNMSKHRIRLTRNWHA